MRAIWQFFLYMAMVMIVILLAFFAVFFIGEVFLCIIFMIVTGSLLLMLYTNLAKRLHTKMDIIEKRVERERTDEVVTYETDPETGVTYVRAYKKHLLETQKSTELLPPSNALMITIEMAYSLQMSISRLDFSATYSDNFKRAQLEKPGIELAACRKLLKKGVEQTFEDSNYWSVIEAALESKSLGDLINELLDITPPSTYPNNRYFFLRDTIVTENALATKYEPGQLVYESAILPAAGLNYPPSTTHRFILYGLPLLTNAQAFTELPNTALISPGYYRVADQYTFHERTMILLCFVTDTESITDVGEREYNITYYKKIIAQARAYFEASFECPPSEAFTSEQWLELMEPEVGGEAT